MGQYTFKQKVGVLQIARTTWIRFMKRFLSVNRLRRSVVRRILSLQPAGNITRKANTYWREVGCWTEVRINDKMECNG